MKPIYVLLVFAHTFSCSRFDVECTEAVTDWLQTDSYRDHSDYKNIWSYRNNINESEACNQEVLSNGIIEVPPDDEPLNESCRIYKWFIHDGDIDGYDVTISSLQLNENVSNFLIISPGSSLVPDEASVVITGKILKPRKFRVIDYNNMTIWLVIQNGNTNETRKDNSFRLSYKAYELTTTTLDTTTPSIPHDATVSVCTVNGTFDHTELQKAVAEMANKYCKDEPIACLDDIQPNKVDLQTLTDCGNCTRVVMAVPVRVPEGHKYELSRSSLESMWEKYAAITLPKFGLQEYLDQTNAEDTDLKSWHNWLFITLSVAVIFTLLLVGLWKFDVLNTSNKKDPEVSPEQRASKASRMSWVSESSSYQEVPPMTDLQYDDVYNQPRENHKTATSTNTHSFSHDRPASSDNFSAAYYFQPSGYDNPSFDHSSEQHHPKNRAYHDDFSTDDESSARTSTDTESHHQAYKHTNHESTL